MRIRFLPGDYSVCKLADPGGILGGGGEFPAGLLSSELVFVAKTPTELSLVCPTDQVPEKVREVESGWTVFRVEGVLDFSLVGVLARLSGALAARGISIFAVSTFDTDYILLKKSNATAAREALAAAGFEVGGEGS